MYELFRVVEAEPDFTTWRQGRALPYGEGVSFWALAEIVKAQAGILESDSPAEAESKLRAAAEVLDGIRYRPGAAYARLRAARELVAHGRRAEADAQLQRALAFWREVGATRYVREGEALLAASA